MRTLLPVTLVAVLLAACGTVDGSTVPSTGGAGSGAVSGEPLLVIADGEDVGPDMSVAEALTHRATDDLVAVTGSLFVDPDGTIRLCDAIAESFPPQCSGERITVEGLNLDAVVGLQTEGQVSWAESVTLFGSVE